MFVATISFSEYSFCHLFIFANKITKLVSQVLQWKIIIVVLHHVLQKNDVEQTGLVVQLVRIHACHAWGRGFESRPDRQYYLSSLQVLVW
jgi:hypothetical protein